MGYAEQFRELKKSIDNNNRLNYFKNELLKILDKKEQKENSVSKSIQSYFDDINKTIYGISIEKGRAGTIGEIRTWKDGKKYKKMPDGKWVRVYQERNRSAEISIARLKGRVRKAQSVDELMQIVMNNIHRFEDENGNVLPIVEELKKEVAASKGKINAGKPSTQQQIEKFKADKIEKENKIKAAEEENTKKKKAAKKDSANKLSIKDFPETFLKGGWKKEFQGMIDYINSFENVNPKIVSMFRNIGKLKYNEPFKVKSLPKNASEIGRLVISVYRDSGIPAESSLQLKKGSIEESKKGFLMPVMLHEMTHLFDYALRPDPQYHRGLSEMDQDLLDVIEDCQINPDEVESIKKEMEQKVSGYYGATQTMNSIASEANRLTRDYRKQPYEYSEYVEKHNKLVEEYNEYAKKADKEHSNYMKEEQFVDILDAITEGEFYGNNIGGHGKSYYNEKSYNNDRYTRKVAANKAKEIFADYVALSIYSPENVERLKKLFPKLVEQLDKTMDKILYNLGAE